MMVLLIASFAGMAQGGGQQRNFDPEEMAKNQTAQNASTFLTACSPARTGIVLTYVLSANTIRLRQISALPRCRI